MTEEEYNETAKFIMDGAAKILDVVRDQFVAADTAFLDEAEKQGMNPVSAFIGLMSLHREVADGMEKRMLAFLGKDAKPIAAADEEE